MPLATSNRAQVRYAVEDAFGTLSTATPNELRMTGESLAFALKSDTSKEIRADRQVTDLILTGASASGGINFELSYKEYDKFIEAAAQGNWLGANDIAIASATITLTNTVTAAAGTPFAGVVVGQRVKFSGFATAANNLEFIVLTASPTVLTVAGTPWTNEAAVAVNFTSFGKTTLALTTTLGTTLTAGSGAPFANVVAGQWVKVSGMTTPANNKLAQVVSKTSSTVLVFAAATFTNEVVASATVSSSRVTNGTTERSWSIERALNDIGQFFAYRGMSLSKMSMGFSSGAVVTGSFDFMGKDSVRATATQLTGTPVASQTYDVMNAVSGVGNILEGGAALTGTFIKSLKFDVDNKLRARDGIGTLGAVAIGSGTVSVTGTMDVYLADGTLYDKFINNTASSIAWSAMDGAGNGYMFQFPKIKFSDAKVTAGGLDQDVMLSIPFTAMMDTVTGKTLIIDRLGA